MGVVLARPEWGREVRERRAGDPDESGRARARSEEEG